MRWLERFVERIEAEAHRVQVERQVESTTRDLRAVGAEPEHIRDSIEQLRRDLEVGQ